MLSFILFFKDFKLDVDTHMCTFNSTGMGDHQEILEL